MSSEKVKKIHLIRKEQFVNDPNNRQQLPLIVNEIKARVGDIKRNKFEIGRLLTKGKKLGPHGGFKKWIEKNFDFSYQTANNFMNVYAYCLKDPQLVHTIPASVLYTIASPKFPNDLREYLFKHGDYLKKLTNKDIKEILKKYRAGEIDLESPEIQALIEYNRKSKKLARYQKQLDENIAALEKLRDTVLKITGKVEWPVMPKKKRTELTKHQQEKIESIIKNTVDAIAGAQPTYRIVESLKPRLEVDAIASTRPKHTPIETLKSVLKANADANIPLYPETVEILKTVLEEDADANIPLNPKTAETLKTLLKAAK